MSAPTTVPVTITPEAAARVAELGMHREMEQMVAYARQAVPELRRIEVTLAERYDTGGDPGVTVTAFSDEAWGRVRDRQSEANHWSIHTFAPQVLEHFLLVVDQRYDHAG